MTSPSCPVHIAAAIANYEEAQRIVSERIKTLEEVLHDSSGLADHMVSHPSLLHRGDMGMTAPTIFCPSCGGKLRVTQSGLQFYNGAPTMWRRRTCKQPDCTNGSHYHSIEIEKPDDMEIDYG